MLKVFELDEGASTYGLSSLSEFSRRHMAMGIRGIEGCYNQFTNPYELTTESKLKQRLGEIAEKPSNQQMGEYKNVVSIMKSNREQVQQDKYRKKLAETLTEKLKTDFLQRACTLLDEYSKAQVEIAVQKWQAYQKWVFQFDEALEHLVVFLNGLKQQLTSALAELNTAYHKRFTLNRIPEAFYLRYRKHLIDQLEVVQNELASVSESALARLELAGRNVSSHEGDLVAHMAKQLADLRVIPKSTGEKVMLKRQFSPVSFSHLHQIVLQTGTQSQKKRLGELPWFRSFATEDNKLNLMLGDLDDLVFNNAFCFGKTFARQFGVAELVPTAPKWPNWLFKNHNLRAQFFDNVTPFAQIALNTQSLDNNAETANMDLPSIQHFVLDVTEANAGFKQFYQAIEQAEAQINRGLRQYFSGTTRTFLSTLSRQVKAKEVATQKNIVTYLNRLTESLKADELKPTEGLMAQIMKIKHGLLSSHESVGVALNNFDEAFYAADKRAKTLAQERTLKEKYDAIMNGFKTQLMADPDKPASLESLQWLLNNIQNTKEGDLYHPLVMEQTELLIRQAKRTMQLPPLPVEALESESLTLEAKIKAFEPWALQMQYCLNQAVVLKTLAPEDNERPLRLILMEAYRQFLLSFSGGEYCRSLPKDIREIVITQQANMLRVLQVGDITLGNVSKLQTHFERGEIDKAVSLAQDELKAFERDWLTKYYRNQFGCLIKKMSEWVVSTLDYTKDQMLGFMDLLDKLSSQMATHHCTDVFDYIKLMKKDHNRVRAENVFGTKPSGFFKSKLEKNQEQSRQCLHVMVRLKLAITRLPHVVSDEARDKLIDTLNQDLKTVANRFGSGTEFAKLMHTHGTFKSCGAELRHTVGQDLLNPQPVTKSLGVG